MVKYIFRIKWAYAKTMIGMSHKSKFLTIEKITLAMAHHLFWNTYRYVLKDNISTAMSERRKVAVAFRHFIRYIPASEKILKTR